MYENAEEALTSILAVVDKCPDPFKEKCFEVLLRGYVDRELGLVLRVQPPLPPVGGAPPPLPQIPSALLPRFQTMAKRIGVELSRLEALYDFTNDPFTYHAIIIPGENNADKTRKVALLVAAKSYLSTGTWTADWQEIKARSIDQNCYDKKNHSTFLRAGQNTLFKSVEAGQNIELTNDGVKEAEQILTNLAQA